MLKKIEEVSKLSGVSKRTLQYYDDEGILSVKRSAENYRLYDDNDMKKLWEILWYKTMGFQLKEIKQLFEITEEERKKYFAQKITKLDEKIQELDWQRKMIQHVKECGTVPVRIEENQGESYKSQIRKMKNNKRV